jgi:hypothetical protein
VFENTCIIGDVVLGLLVVQYCGIILIYEGQCLWVANILQVCGDLMTTSEKKILSDNFAGKYSQNAGFSHLYFSGKTLADLPPNTAR